jgi:hypothetical protein
MPAFSLATLIRALLIWLLIMAAESVHGALRRALLTPEVDFAIRQISVAVAALIIFALTWVFLDWIRVRSVRGALALGIVWAGLTLAFELALGRLTGTPWDRIAADYDLAHGGLMPLGLLAMSLTPWAVQALQARRKRRALEPPTR